MTLLRTSVILAGGGVLLLGLGLALSGAPSSASQVQPNKTKVSCNKSTYCFEAGNSGTGAGLEGIADGSPPYAGYPGGVAGLAFASKATGVYGYSDTGEAGHFENASTSYPALVAQFDGIGYGYSFEALGNNSGASYFAVDLDGNGYFTGSVYTQFAPVVDQRTIDGGREGTFGVQSTRAALEDIGTARLTDGVSRVHFDAAFARTLDLRQGYQVFLTPGGETRGLYVLAKYEGGFVVREIEHGHSSIPFDYRVVAHPFGAPTARLPQLNLKAPPRIPSSRIQR